MGTGAHPRGAGYRRGPRAPPSVPRRAVRRRSRSRGDESAADRVPGQLYSVSHAELLEHVGPVAVDRLAADHEHLGDLVARVTLGHELQHLQLARRQRIDVVTDAGTVEVIPHE